MDAGYIAYLGKPFAQHVLLDAISKAVALADAAKTKSA
jgi:FixJ family two-component response regulator